MIEVNITCLVEGIGQSHHPYNMHSYNFLFLHYFKYKVVDYAQGQIDTTYLFTNGLKVYVPLPSLSNLNHSLFSLLPNPNTDRDSILPSLWKSCAGTAVEAIDAELTKKQLLTTSMSDPHIHPCIATKALQHRLIGKYCCSTFITDF